MSCPFCETNGRILKENDRAYVILSNPRKVEGHFLVIPKRHVEHPTDITKEEIVDIFELIKLVQGKILGALGTGCNVRQNYLPFLPDSQYKVSHIHYHVLPRNDKDRMYLIADQHDRKLFESLSQEEHDRIAKLLD